MRGLPSVQNALFYLQAAALFGVLARFLTSDLYRTYRFFFLFLIVETLQLAIPFFLKTVYRNLYAYLYLATEGLIVCFYALNVLELYSLVLKDLPGISTIARRYVQRSVVVAVLAAIVVLQFEQIPPGVLPLFYTAERSIVSILVVFVLLITAFLVYYPVPLNRNVIFYTIGYAFYFVNKAIALFLRNTGKEWDQLTNVVVLAGSSACLIFWIFALTPEGEKKTVTLGHRWEPEDEHRLIGQLNAINASLLRARK